MADKIDQNQQQSQLNLALKMARVAFWEFDLAQNTYILNDQAFAVLRTSAEKQGGYTIPSDEFARRFIHPDDIPAMTESFHNVLHAADPDFASEHEYRGLFGDGQTGYLNVLFKAERDGNGRITRLYGTGQDITQRRQAEEELKLNKIQFKTLFDTASDDIELLDPQANIVDCNETHAHMLGYGRDELIGRNVTEFFTEDTIQRFEEKFPKLLEKGYVKCEMGLRHKDGNIIRVWRQAQAVQDDNGNLKGILIHNRDIMDPYMIEEQIELQNIALKASASAIVITDTYGIVQWANPAFTQLTGYEPEEVIGQNPNVLKSGVHDDAFYANMWQTLTNGEVWRSEIVNRKKDGTFYTEEMTITPVRAHGDEITNYIAIKQDITERKQVEAAITKQAVEMKTVAEVSTAAATIRDTDQLLQSVVDLAKARFELYHAHIYLFNAQGDELVLTVGAGDIGQQMVAQKHSIPVNQEKSLVAKAARNQKGVIENDVLRNPAFLPNPLLPETRSEMAVPMMIGDRVIGVLDVQARRVGRFTPQDVTVKTALAAQIAVALENARSYEQARTSLAETEALLDITKETSRVLELEDIMTSVLDKVLVTTGFNAGLITVVNPGTNNLEIVSHHLPEPFLHMLEEKGLDGTLCDLVYRRQENVVVANMAESAPIDVTGLLSMGYQSYQGVPLESKGTVLGTLCLFSQRPITSERANSVFLQAVGQQVGIAIQNTALFNQTQAALFEAQQSRQSVQEFLDMQRALQEINIELFNIDDLDELYRSAVELAHTRLGFERVGMYLLNESKDLLLGTYGIDVTGNICNEQGPAYVIDQAETIDTFILNRNRLVVDEDIDLWYQGEAVGRGWHIGSAMWTEDFPIGVIFADNLLTGQPLKPYQAELLFAYAGIVSNLIQRNRFEEAIRERETLLRTIIDSTPDWIFVKDRDHRYQMVNKGYADTFQITPDDFIGKNDLDIGFPEEIVKGDPEKGIRGFWADDLEIMETGQMKVIDIEPAVVDGEQRYLNTIKAPLKDGDGRVTAVIGFVHDITDRIRSEETLAKQARELQIVAEVSTKVATTLEQENLLQEVVDLAKSRFDLYHAQIYLLNAQQDTLLLAFGAGDVGQKLVAQTHRISLNAPQSLVAQAARSGQAVVVNNVRDNPDWLPNELLPETQAEMAAPMMVGNQVVGVLDVQSSRVNRFTDQDVQIKTTLAAQVSIALQNARSYEQMQEAFKNAEQSEQFLNTLINTIPNPIFYKDTNGTYIGMNQAFLEMLGVEPEALLGKSVFDLQTDQELAQKYHEMDVALFENPSEPQIYESQLTNATGQIRDVVFNKNVFNQADGSLGGLVGVILDITERKKSEEALQERETLLNTIVDSTPDWIFVKDRDHRYQMVNKGYADSLQIPPDNFIGKNDLDIGFPEEIVKGNPEKGIRGFWADDLEIMETGQMKVIDIEPAVVDGKQRYLSTIKAPLKDADGQVTAVIGFVHDITDRIQAEETLAKQANELADLTRRLTRESWQDYLNQATSKDIGYLFDSTAAKPIKPISETPDKTSFWLEDGSGTQPAQPLVRPITIHGETIGQLAVLPEDGENEVDPEVAEVIYSVIEQLGARIENLRLTDQTQMALAQTEEQAHRLGKLNEMSTALNHAASLNDIFQVSVDETTRVMNVDETSISLLMETKEHFEIVAASSGESSLPLGVPLSVTETPMQVVLQENRIVYGALDGVFALSLHIPLMIGNDVIGTLNVGYKEAQAFKPSDESLLRQVAALVSSNIENMRFLVNERTRAQREQMLRQITQRIRSSADVETIMRTAVQEIGRTLGRKTYIYLGDDHEA